MVWQIIESPSAALKKVIIAEHKNFVLFLALFLGLGAQFGLMWMTRFGNQFDNLFPLLLYGIGVGFIIALPLFFLLVGVLFVTAKSVGGKANFRDTYGVAGWSLVPVMLSVVFVLPLELSTVGLLFYSSNPSALEVKPAVTMVLLGLDGLMAAWSMMLAAKGMAMVHRFNLGMSGAVTVASVAVVAYITLYFYSSFTS